MPSSRTWVLFAVVLALGSSVPALASGATTDGGCAPCLELKPARFAAEIPAGTSRLVSVTLTNRIDETLDVSFRVLALEAGDVDSFAKPAGRQLERSAQGWVSAPPAIPSMQPGAVVRERVRITVPRDARPGAYAVALAASQTFSAIGSTGDSIGSRVEARVNLGSTFVIVVPGAAVAAAKVVSTNSPRIIWGDERPTFGATVENAGDTLLKLEAATELSSFGAFASRTLRSDEQPTLPGGRRELRMRWSDRPWIGWYTPRLVVVGGTGSGVRVEQDLPTVFVVPPWWVVALALVAVALPIWSHRRRRRAMRAYMAQRRDERHEDDA